MTPQIIIAFLSGAICSALIILIIWSLIDSFIEWAFRDYSEKEIELNAEESVIEKLNQMKGNQP